MLAKRAGQCRGELPSRGRLCPFPSLPVRPPERLWKAQASIILPRAGYLPRGVSTLLSLDLMTLVLAPDHFRVRTWISVQCHDARTDRALIRSQLHAFAFQQRC